MPDASPFDSGPQAARVVPLRTAALGDLSDEQLVGHALRRDVRAFEALMRRHNQRLFRVARSILLDDAAAEDAVQEAYIRAFTSLDRYAPTGRFSSWLVRVVINEALMLRRRKRPDTLSFEQLGRDMALQQEAPSALCAPDALEAMHARELLERAVDALPERFRTVFILRMVEQLDVGETARCLGLKQATVRTRLHRARHLIRAELVRRLRREKLNVFEFDGERCDRIVAGVLRSLQVLRDPREHS